MVQAIDFDFPMLKCFDIDECRDGEINTFFCIKYKYNLIYNLKIHLYVNSD